LIAELTGNLDFVINAVISHHFRAFMGDVMEVGVELNKIASGANFCDVLSSRSHATVSGRLRKRTHDVFEECFRIIRQEHRFINLLMTRGQRKASGLCIVQFQTQLVFMKSFRWNPTKTMARQQQIMSPFSLKQ
jgi:hypothetical protein